MAVTSVRDPITGKETLQHVKVKISPIAKRNPFVTSDESSPEASTSSVGASSSSEGACAVFVSTPVSPPSPDSFDALGSTAALIGMESSTQTDPSYRHDYAGRPLSPPPRYDMIDVRRNIYSDLDSDSETEMPELAGPEQISGSVRDMSLVPQRLTEPFRQIAPLPAGLTPPLMPRITNYAWAGAGDWEEAAGIGETIRTNSPWSSMEGSVIEDLLRPLTSFADVRRYVTLDPFIDDDEDDDDIRSVDSYGRALTPIQRDPEEMHERGRARPDAQPPQPEPIMPLGLLQAGAVGGARRRVPLQRVQTGTFNFV